VHQNNCCKANNVTPKYSYPNSYIDIPKANHNINLNIKSNPKPYHKNISDERSNTYSTFDNSFESRSKTPKKNILQTPSVSESFLTFKENFVKNEFKIEQDILKNILDFEEKDFVFSN